MIFGYAIEIVRMIARVIKIYCNTKKKGENKGAFPPLGCSCIVTNLSSIPAKKIVRIVVILLYSLYGDYCTINIIILLLKYYW